MNSIACYLFFLAALSSYRSSKYWPMHFQGFFWLVGQWKVMTSMMLGIILMCLENGTTIGLLLALCMIMLAFSAVVIFANCKSVVRLSALYLFHFFCLLGMIVSF